MAFQRVALSSAALTPGSSWAVTRQPCSVSGGRNAARPSRKTCPAISLCSSGNATEDLNRPGTSATPATRVTDVQRRVKHSAIPWMAATLDGVVEETERCSKPSSCCRGRSPRRRRQKSTWPSCSTTCGSHTCRTSVLSIITGGGKWVEITIPMDPLYLSVLVSAEKKFWRCVQSGEAPSPVQCRAAATTHRGHPHRGHELVEFLGGICRRVPQHAQAFLDHERAKGELKALMPEDAKEAIGHGVRAKRSKSGAVSFDVLERWPMPCTGPVNRSRRLAAALAKAQAELVNPEKSLTATIRTGRAGEGRTQLSLCLAVQRPRHRAQDARPTRDRDRTDDGHRPRRPAWSI